MKRAHTRVAIRDVVVLTADERQPKVAGLGFPREGVEGDPFEEAVFVARCVLTGVGRAPWYAAMVVGHGARPAKGGDI